MRTKKRNKKVWLVELKNKTDRQDNEAVKVKAYSSEDARKVANQLVDTFRFYVGDAVPARGGTKMERWTATGLRMICDKGVLG